MNEVSVREKETKSDWVSKKDASKAAAAKFEECQLQRIDLFNKAFAHISMAIADIYKSLTKSDSHPVGGKAYLTLENPDEGFSGGIKYTAMPPMKRFRDMDQLSGGEKTIAALALLFAIHSYHPAPFFVLDEVDAALDNINVSIVSDYIRHRAEKEGLQCIVISLKDTFYTKADALVGVFKDKEKETSGVLTLDLNKYE